MDSSSFQLAGGVLLLGVSGVGTIFAALVHRSVKAQDEKINGIASDVKEVREQVGDHAAQLAESKAEIKELSRRASALERQVYDVSVHGCARACPGPTPIPRGDGG